MVDEHREGVVLGLLAYTIWGLLTLYWHALDGIAAFELIAIRICTSVVILGALLTVRRSWPALRRALSDRRLLGRLVLAALLLSTNWTTYVWCVTHDRVIETALGYFIAPLGTVVIGVLVLGERLRRAQVVALALAGAAVVVLTVGYGRVPWLALVLASSWAVYGLLKKVVPLGPLESLSAETLVLAPVAVVVLVAYQLSGTGALSTAQGDQVALLAFTGLVTVVPLLLFAAAAPRIPLSVLGPLQYLVPSINFVLGVALYHEPLPAWRLFGFALVWVGLVVFTVDALRSTRRSAAVAEAAIAAAAVE